MFKLGRIIEAFVKRSPVAVLVHAVLQRDLDPETLDKLFQNTADAQYEKNSFFPP